MDRKYKKYLILPLAALGAYLYRLRGGGPGPKLPRPLDQILFSSFPCIILPLLCMLGTHHTSWPWWLAFALSSVWAVAWECSGHGGFMDLGTWLKARSDELIEFLIKPLHGKISEYWYDALGITLTGLIVTLAPGIFIIATGGVAGGVLLALSGALKGPGYMLGWKLFGGTGAGEWISGGLRWAAAGVTWWAFL